MAIHSERVLAKFLKQQMKAHPDLDLPALPAAGNLDIRQVLSIALLFRLRHPQCCPFPA